ncbi:MAG: SurA N-terminal domain-containing protein [Clostridia bacterium]|nr:SurA N-terminal domain-containing protein [Clostridia bacterium]
MKKMNQWLSLLLCFCMLAVSAALAEAQPAAPVIPGAELQDDAVLATVNGEEITWGHIKEDYQNLADQAGAYYDMTEPATVDMFRAYILEDKISRMVILEQAAANGIVLSQEDEAEIIAQADISWEAAIANYIEYYHPDLNEESGQEDKAEARAAAEAYYGEMGLDLPKFRELSVQNEQGQRLYIMVTQDVAVTDADVEADYQAKVAADKEMFGNDISAYFEYNSYVDQSNLYAMMSGTAGDMEYAWYRPAGFRAVKHILLPVDEELMGVYKDLQARLEEQMDKEAYRDEEGEAPADPPEPEQAPVTQGDVDQAKADILTSLAGPIDEINQMVAQGESFDKLIETYAVNTDGSPTDPGMVSEPYRTGGYEVARESDDYVPEFVEAAFSVDHIGDVTAPYLSDFGVHILQYIGDVEEGPIPMTAEQREARRVSLLDQRKDELFSQRENEWRAAASVTYTGAVPTIEEIEAAYADEEDYE